MRPGMFPWVAWATVTTAAGTAASAGYELGRAAGLGPVTAGVAAIAAQSKALSDLGAAYGTATAVLLSSGTVAGAHAWEASGGTSAGPSLASAAVSLCVHVAMVRRTAGD